MTYTFRPRGVCSQEMRVEVDDAGIIQKMEVLGGCSGNLQGISALVVGMPAQEAVGQSVTLTIGGRPYQFYIEGVYEYEEETATTGSSDTPVTEL